MCERCSAVWALTLINSFLALHCMLMGTSLSFPTVVPSALRAGRPATSVGARRQTSAPIVYEDVAASSHPSSRGKNKRKKRAARACGACAPARVTTQSTPESSFIALRVCMHKDQQLLAYCRAGGRLGCSCVRPAGRSGPIARLAPSAGRSSWPRFAMGTRHSTWAQHEAQHASTARAKHAGRRSGEPEAPSRVKRSGRRVGTLERGTARFGLAAHEAASCP